MQPNSLSCVFRPSTSVDKHRVEKLTLAHKPMHPQRSHAHTRTCPPCPAQVKSGGMATAKDLEMSPFEAARRLLSVDGEVLSLGCVPLPVPAPACRLTHMHAVCSRAARELLVQTTVGDGEGIMRFAGSKLGYVTCACSYHHVLQGSN